TLASAAQLTLNPATEIQAGVAQVNAGCQTAAVPVAFAAPALAGGVYTSTSVILSNIADLCETKHFSVSFLDVNGNVLGDEVDGTVTDDTIEAAITGTTHDLIKQIAVAIY